MSKLTFVACHRIPERSFFFKGKQFPLCARCTGIHVGFLSMPLFIFGFVYLSMWWSLILIIPTYLDGFVQAKTSYESNNTLSFITGFFSGIGKMSLVSILGGICADFILLFL